MLQKSSLEEPKGDEDLQFCWGRSKGTANLYESFTLDGIEYSLYDCVYMWRADQDEPDIGKLVRIWETDDHEKKVEVVWFFRPTEITNWLEGIKTLQREIFLACGQGKGLSNVDPLEAISGKCNVVCSSKHIGNSQPTEEELRKADHIFYRTFDVGKYIISEKFPSSIGGVEVRHFFNRRKYLKPTLCARASSASRSGETPAVTTKDGQSPSVEKGFKVPAAPISRERDKFLEDGIHSGAKGKSPKHFQSAGSSDVGQVKKRKLLDSLEGCGDDARPYPQSRVSVHEKHLNVKDSCKEKGQSTRVNLDEKARKSTEDRVGSKQHMRPTNSYTYLEVRRRPDMDSSKWFKPKVRFSFCGTSSWEVE